MNAKSSYMTMLVFILLLNYTEGASLDHCDQVPTYIDHLYQQLKTKRKCSVMAQGLSTTTSAIPWRNSSLRLYFNLSCLSVQTEIFRAHLVLHRGRTSFLQRLMYQDYFGLILKDINTSRVVYNRTLPSSDRYCLVKNLLHLVKRWKNVTASNQGLLLTVKDTGRYSTTLETFYPKKKKYAPALALFLKPRRNSLKRYELIPIQFIEILNTKT